MSFVKSIYAGLMLTALSSPVFAQTIFIKDAKIVTNSAQGTIENANLVVQDGQITAFGPNADEPRNADVVGGENIWVTPGLFAPITSVGLYEIGGESSTNDTRSESGETSVSDLAVDSFNSQSPMIDITRIEGITHVASSGSAARNIFAGTGLIATMSGEFDSVKDSRAFVYAQLGSRGAGLAGGSRSAAMSQLRAALDDALAYTSRYDGPDDGDTLPRRDAAALIRAVRGRIPLVIGADRASDLLRIAALKDEYVDLDIIVAGAAEGWMVTKQLKAAGIKVIIEPHKNLPENFDRVGSRFDNAAILNAAGVELAISSGSSYLLPQHAGNAVSYGLPWEAAFAAISSVPAGWFGIDTGTLQKDTPATLVVWNGDPLEVTSAPIFIMIDGKVQSLTSRQTELRDRYHPLSEEKMPYKYR